MGDFSIIYPNILVEPQDHKIEIFGMTTKTGPDGMNIHIIVQNDQHIIYEGITRWTLQLNNILESIRHNKYQNYSLKFDGISYHFNVETNKTQCTNNIILQKTSKLPIMVTSSIKFEKRNKALIVTLQNNLCNYYVGTVLYSDLLQTLLEEVSSGKHKNYNVKFGLQCCYLDISHNSYNTTDNSIIVLQQLPKKLQIIDIKTKNVNVLFDGKFYVMCLPDNGKFDDSLKTLLGKIKKGIFDDYYLTKNNHTHKLTLNFEYIDFMDRVIVCLESTNEGGSDSNCVIN